MGTGVRGGLVVVVAVAAVAAVAGCKSSGSHIYLAEAYEPARGCVDPSSSVDIVDGNDPGSSCAIKCLVAPAAEDGGQTTYVSTMCPPYPPLFDVSGTGPECAGAFAAFQRGDVCQADGGSTNPAADAGGE